ncbi:unnamed protein product [Closterium sp. NIES-53]
MSHPCCPVLFVPHPSHPCCHFPLVPHPCCPFPFVPHPCPTRASRSRTCPTLAVHSCSCPTRVPPVLSVPARAPLVLSVLVRAPPVFYLYSPFPLCSTRVPPVLFVPVRCPPVLFVPAHASPVSHLCCPFPFMPHPGPTRAVCSRSCLTRACCPVSFLCHPCCPYCAAAPIPTCICYYCLLLTPPEVLSRADLLLVAAIAPALEAICRRLLPPLLHLPLLRFAVAQSRWCLQHLGVFAVPLQGVFAALGSFFRQLGGRVAAAAASLLPFLT